MPETGKLKSEVHERLVNATQRDQWVQDLLAGNEPNLAELDAVLVLGGLTSLTGGIIDALQLLAAELERQDAKG
ncbi:MAG TPA: hypothetical protein VMB51_00255 [Solirubrobacteraceae bacterium]|nr:hypothetical protein [Solirubrobacteraceae bacterium]